MKHKEKHHEEHEHKKEHHKKHEHKKSHKKGSMNALKAKIAKG